MIPGFLWVTQPEEFEQCRFVRTQVFIEEQGFSNEFDEMDQTAHHLLFLDDEKHMVYVKDQPCSLTFKEYELLKLLLHNAGIVVTREIILERVWGIDFEGESRTLDMHIRTLRQKLGDAGTMIRTVRNVGYMIE